MNSPLYFHAMYFRYGKKEIDFLSSKDKKLGKVISSFGHIKRETEKDLFRCLAYQIAGQQISSKALKTVWEKLEKKIGSITSEKVAASEIDTICSSGLSRKKALNIKTLAEKIDLGSLSFEKIKKMSDTDAIKELTSLSGVGVWTAEMTLLFCFSRPDILSFGDYGIQKGLRMLHGKDKITKKDFEKYKTLYSPYGSTASLYLWEIAGGKAKGMKDPLEKVKTFKQEKQGKKTRETKIAKI